MSDPDTPTPESSEQSAAAALVSAEGASAHAEEASARWREAKSDADERAEAAAAARDALAEIGAESLETLQGAARAARRAFDLADACTQLTRARADELTKRALEARRHGEQTKRGLEEFEGDLAGCEAAVLKAERALATSQAGDQTARAGLSEAVDERSKAEASLAKANADTRPLETAREAAAAASREAAAAAAEEAEALALANARMAASAKEFERLTHAAEDAAARVAQEEEALGAAKARADALARALEEITARATETANDAMTKSQAMARAKTPTEMQQVASEVAACAKAVGEWASKQEAARAEADEASEAVALAEETLSATKEGAELAEREKAEAAAALEAEEANLGNEGVKTRLAGEKAAALELAVEAYDLARASVEALRAELKTYQAAQRRAEELLAAAGAQREDDAARLETANQARDQARALLEEERGAASRAESMARELEEAAEAAAEEVEGFVKRARFQEEAAQAHEAAAARLEAELQRELEAESPRQAELDLEGEEPSLDTVTLTVSTPDAKVGEFRFSKDVLTLGRDKTCDVHLDSEIVSRRHAEIRRNDALFALVDMNTSNGTFLNGKLISELTLLNDDDGIGIGKFRIHFSARTAASAFNLDSDQMLDDGVDLGGMTLRMSPESAKRVVGDFNRVRGYVLLARKGGPDLKRLVTETFQVGKDPCCDLILKGWFVPRKAALICRGFDRYSLINMSPSPKSVLANGRQVYDRVVLEDGDKVEVYGQEFRFELAEDPS